MKCSSLFLVIISCLFVNVALAQEKADTKTEKSDYEDIAALSLGNILVNEKPPATKPTIHQKKRGLFGMPVYDPSDTIDAKIRYWRPPSGYFYSMPNAFPERDSSAVKKYK